MLSLQVLRITTITPFWIPHFVKEDFYIDDHLLTRGTTLLPNSWHSHHRDDHWPDPWTFQPHRFLDSDGQLLDSGHPVRQKLLVFGTGVRICPAENFSRSRVFLLVVSLIQRFRFKPPSGTDLPSELSRDWKPGMVFWPDEFKCQLELRK